LCRRAARCTLRLGCQHLRERLQPVGQFGGAPADGNLDVTHRDARPVHLEPHHRHAISEVTVGVIVDSGRGKDRFHRRRLGAGDGRGRRHHGPAQQHPRPGTTPHGSPS
jgi:hypothetical protein